jgi:sugar phosphate isomerase/epimerase
MTLTRRDLGKLALAAVPAAKLLAKPNSLWNGVQVGMNVPYSYGNNNMTSDETIAKTVELGVSAVECRTQPIEEAMGSPAVHHTPPPTGRGSAPLTAEQKAAEEAYIGELKKWRLSRSADQMATGRRKFDDAGIAIQVMKVDWMPTADDETADYCFRLAKAVGARAISCEIDRTRTKWLGAIAAKHKMMVGYHGHTDTTNPEHFGAPESWEQAMSYSPYNGINLDLGHFVAANNTSPIPFLTKYHDKVTHIHVKDRKMNGGPAVAFGEGDVPLHEVFKLMAKEKWAFQATIEFEYPVPEGSNRMAEIAKCVGFCKACLL